LIPDAYKYGSIEMMFACSMDACLSGSSPN
jgi:hypothetical protein